MIDISEEQNVNVIQVTLIYATANLKVGIEIFCRIVGGFLWEEKPLANNWFVGLGYTTILNGLSFSQDLKLCSYYFVSPTLDIDTAGLSPLQN